MATQVGSAANDTSPQPVTGTTLLVQPRGKEKVETQLANSTKKFALEALYELGFTQLEVQSFTKKMGTRGFSAVVNFKLACEMMDLPLSWGEEQVRAFLIYINYKYYSTGYLDRMWSTIKKLGKHLDCPITEAQEADFELVLDAGKELKDNKVPVSRDLLKKLCHAADTVFEKYNAALAKAVCHRVGRIYEN